MKSVYLVEDHDEVLKIWQASGIKGLDLVHIDAHIDFGVHQALSLEDACLRARSVGELKKKLELSLAYLHYEENLDKQTDIGNYVYPAMSKGMVSDFYWVIPGSRKVFAESIPLIRNILRGLFRNIYGTTSLIQGIKVEKNSGRVSCRILERNFTVCCLDYLPEFKNEVLVDIDSDFLVIPAIKAADSSKEIGKRKIWLNPRELVNIVNKKILRPGMTTIAYSTNGGFTPMSFRYLADEIAFFLEPGKFKSRYWRSRRAKEWFNLFLKEGKKYYYWKAAAADPYYRGPDNNYGPLYLQKNKMALAREEFRKIRSVDPENPASLLGLGDCALVRRDYVLARDYLRKALSNCRSRIFAGTRVNVIFCLALAEYRLGNLKDAQRLFGRYRRLRPLDPRPYYWLAEIMREQGRLEEAIGLYRDSIRLGYAGCEPVSRLAKIISTYPVKRDIILFVKRKMRGLKRKKEKR